MDLCGSGDRAKVSKLVSEENQPPISEEDARFLASISTQDASFLGLIPEGCRSDTDSTSSDSDDGNLKRQPERQLERFREWKRNRMTVLKSASEENQPPKYENEFEDSDSSDSNCTIESDSGEEDGGWFGLYERDSSSNKEPGETNEYCAKLAINDYNSREGTHYRVVDILRAENFPVVGILCFITFTAKLLEEHNDDAFTFRAEVLLNYVDDITRVQFVDRQIIGPLTKEEMTHALGRDRYR